MSFVVLLSGNRPPEGGARAPPFGENGERKPLPDPGPGGLKPARGPAGRPGLANGLVLLGKYDPVEGLGLGDLRASFGDCIGTPAARFASRSQYTFPIHSK